MRNLGASAKRLRVAMASWLEWVGAARPRTLPAAVAPVLVGGAAAAHVGGFHLGRALLAAGVALALQVGVNYANDYSDGIRGTDATRGGSGPGGTGPTRLTASGAVAPRRVKAAAFAWFGMAGALGLALTIATGMWWLLAVGAAAIIAAWFYTGGERPYGYAGLGEVFVFLFFGLVATLGTTFTQLGRVTLPAVLGACGIGLLACAILMVNNIRDIPTDVLAGKRTLAARIGDGAARWAFTAMIYLAVLLGLGVVVVISAHLTPIVLAALMFVPAAVLVRLVLRGATGRDLIPPLAGTATFELAYATLLATALTSLRG